ncbi:MAG: phage antirepressor N-terminal domain-containing protein [Ktedonobacteraceae bacterium]
MSDEQELIPIEQQTLTFYGKPIIVVRLPDGRPGVVLRFLCENLHIDTNAQMQRVQRSEAMAEDLVFTRVETPGGAQRMATLVLRSIAYWFATIDTRRMDKDDPRRLAIVQYQREAVDVLYSWASAPQMGEVPSTTLVPSEPIVEPPRPAADASLAVWHEYYVRMAAVLQWQMEVEAWRSGVEDRLEGLEEISGLIPEILERLPALTITPAHQHKVKYYVFQLSQATGQHPARIYSALYKVFNVPRYQELLEAEWEQVERWFQAQLERKG